MWDVRYRPTLFSDVVGQEGVLQVLKARIKKGTVFNTSYIFAGGPGQGKTTLARILARAALCPNTNKETGEPCNQCPQCVSILSNTDSAFEEKDAANGGTIEVVREMLSTLPYAPPHNAPIRIWLFDEAHRLSPSSQDALLKPIEEKQIIAIFCTTEGKKIVGPIYRRCEEYSIRKVSRESILKRAKFVLESEGVGHQDEAVMTVIDHCQGHVRDVLNQLEAISQMGDITIEAVREYLNLGLVGNFYQTILNLGNNAVVVPLIEDMCTQMSPEDVASGLAEASMNAFRIGNGLFADMAFTDRELAKQVFARFGGALVKLVERFLRARSVTKVSLLCEVLSAVDSSGTALDPSSGAQTVLMVSAPASPLILPTSPVVDTPAVTPAPTPSQPAPTPLPPSKPNGQTHATNGVGLRSDGIGPLGKDPMALTVLDHKAVPMEQPRKMNTPSPTLKFDPHGDVENMKSAEWRGAFERRWMRRG